MMNKNDVCIVIPIYKKVLNDYEVLSVVQCLKVLTEYKVYFVGPKGMDTNYYRSKFSEIENYIFFNEMYFKDLKGYNRLMLSPFFYKTFNNFKYLLVYQTDCYVFRDELLYWVNKEFDFIGGVLFKDYIGDPHKGAKLWQAGNGGLSLRKIDSITELLNSRKVLKSLPKLFIDAKRLKKFGMISYIKGLLLLPFRLLGYKNNFTYRAKNYTENEDGFFIEAGLIYKAIKLPRVEDAIGFSWDRHPNFLFKTYGYYPFGCHAWFREDSHYVGNKEFWSKHIKNNNA